MKKITLFLCLLASCSTLAQTSAPIIEGNDVEITEQTKKIIQRKTGQSEPGNELNVNEPTFQVSTAESTTVASINFQIFDPNDNLTLTFSAPVNKNDDTTLASLDGLAKYNTVKLGYKGTLFAKPNKTAMQILNECRKIAGIVKGPCSPDTRLAKDIKGDLADAYKNLLVDVFSGGVYTYGFDAEVGTKKFSYFSNINAEKKTEDNKQAWSLGVHVSYYSVENYATSISYERRSEYKSKDNITFCRELNQSCVSGSVGAPDEKESDIGTVQFRYFFEKYGAATLKVEHNFDTHNTKVELPLYIIQSKNDFTGGLALGWDESDPGITFGLFVGKSFSL